MMEEGLAARFASGLELNLGEENMKRIDELLMEISKLSNVAKLFLFLKLPGQVNMFKSQQKRDAKVDSVCVQWIKSHLEPHPNFSLWKKEVYDNYKSFCISSGFGYVSLADFGKNLRATVKTVHHRRLGRRGEALYAYAGVKFLEEVKPFVVPDLSKVCSETEELFEPNITNGGENRSDDDDDNDLNNGNDEICDRWNSSVHAAVRNLILEWAEKVIDKNIKFRKYRQLAEHLFNKDFINTNSKDAFILLSDMRLSSTDKVLLQKPPASSNTLNSVSSKADENVSNMQSQTKRKLFSTLTKRDELRQQKKRAKQEDPDQNLDTTDYLLSKSCNSTIKSLNVRSSSAENNTLNVQKTLKGSIATTKSCTVTKSCLATLAVKRPASAHQKVILPKIARTHDATSFVAGPNYDATNSASVSQFLLLSPGSSSQLSSTIAPVVFALLPQQTTLAKNQVTPATKQQHELLIAKQNEKNINNLVDDIKQDCGKLNNQSNSSKCIVHLSQSIEKAPLSLASSSSSSLVISSQCSNKDTHKTSFLLPKNTGRQLLPGRASTHNNLPMSDDNFPGPHDFHKVFNHSKFIESILNDVANNPFGLAKDQSCAGQNPITSEPVFHAPAVSAVVCKPAAKSKNVSTTKNKLSNQTVSMLLSRQNSKNGESLNSQLKLVSDRRPVSQILQDKREKYNSELVKLVGKLPQNTTQIIQLPALSQLQNVDLLGQINSGTSILQHGSCDQSTINNLCFSLPSNDDESFKKSQPGSVAAPISYYFKLPTCNLTDRKTKGSQDSQNIEIEQIVDDTSSVTEVLNSALSRKESCITEVIVESGNNEAKGMTTNSPSSSSSVLTPALKSGKSQLLQLLNEPIIHPDGSVVFQKNCDPSEILSWFESQGSATVGCQKNFNKQQLQILNDTNKNTQVSMLNNPRKHSINNRALCSPISFISDKSRDEVFMPYIDNFVENFTFQQLSEAFKSKTSKSDFLSLLQKSGKQHISSFSTSLSKQQQDGRPISASVVQTLPSNINDSSKIASRFSRPSTVTSLAVDDSDRVFETGASKDTDSFTPVQMIEKLTPGTTGVKHPQPLIGSAFLSDKMSNESSETSKLLDFNWNAFVPTDQVKKPSIGGFVPYSSTGATHSSESQVRHKPVEPREKDSFMISEDSLNMFLSTFRQRHSSAHEISTRSSGDPWMSNGILPNESSARVEAEMEAAFQQVHIENLTNHSLRCHSEPSKYRIPSLFSLENELLMESDVGMEMGDDRKIDNLPARDETLVDMTSNNDLDVLFEEGYDDSVVNFGNDGYFWNGSGGISDHLICGLSPPKVVPAKSHHQLLTFLDSQKEMSFLADNGDRLEGVETLNSDNEESI